MLDRAKVMRELSGASSSLFLDFSQEYEQAYAAWLACTKDTLLIQKVRAHPTYNLATWHEWLAQKHAVVPYKSAYHIVSVDGSQIYPDKHQGTTCFLINIGTVVMHYGQGEGVRYFASEPFLFVEHDLDDELSRGVDVVNGKREEFEFQNGLTVCTSLQAEYPDDPILFLFDGSLIFWHLEAKEAALKQYFLQAYCQLLEQFQALNIPIMGYISLPKSKDIVQIVRAHMTDFSPSLTERTQKIPHTIDTGLCYFFLEPGQRTILFESHTPITAHYPPALRPWFCYYATAYETVRLEFPYYVACDSDLLERCIAIVADQVMKGNGYPISTAEAHVQAVVKGPDREFFYHAVEKYSVDQKKRLLMSQKSLKKRKMSI